MPRPYYVREDLPRFGEVGEARPELFEAYRN